MSSHYQQYLKAIGQKEDSRSVSSSSPPVIARKPANRSVSPMISSPIQSPNGLPSPSPQQRSVSVTPASTAPSSVANIQQPPPTPLASHPPDPIPTTTKPEPVAVHLPDIRNLKTFTGEQTSTAFSTLLRLLTSAVTEHDKGPFVAILLGPDNQTVLQTQFSISATRRAENELARSAAEQYSSAYLSKCTLVSVWEPCPMSAGTIYLSGIGRVLYAASQSKLKDLSFFDESVYMPLSCRTVFSSGLREVEVIGPVAGWEDKVVQESSTWHRERNGTDSLSKAASIRSNGTGRGHAQGETTSVVTTWTREDSVLSSIGEDGEYKADLDIDWMK